ncbi:hypothetical protein [Streptomyces rishiriensis]|uniref:C2H2-type domain-containing protein n=1 Tax=Streptomyces rishiriensis TaxID=68264 RepID=A0ABU0NHA2_STRRH|nr:hypothetical protein [Streptomyces rishiriensis]MDQ0578478.1 hypothetical protein [Streptomyces rishiriensis]
MLEVGPLELDGGEFGDTAISDRPDCLASYLEPDDRPEQRPVKTALAAAGRQLDDDADHARPGCVRGSGPVLARGECPHSCGSTFDRADGAVCHHCGHLSPHPPEDGFDLD